MHLIYCSRRTAGWETSQEGVKLSPLDLNWLPHNLGPLSDRKKTQPVFKNGEPRWAGPLWGTGAGTWARWIHQCGSRADAQRNRAIYQISSWVRVTNFPFCCHDKHPKKSAHRFIKKTWAKDDSGEKGSGRSGLHVLVLLVYRTQLEEQTVTFQKLAFLN